MPPRLPCLVILPSFTSRRFMMRMARFIVCLKMNMPSGTSVLTSSIVSLEFSGSLAIMKTLPGHANMIASIIDGAAFKSVISTIAGDDTILIIVREGNAREAVIEELGKMFEGLNKLIQ